MKPTRRAGSEVLVRFRLFEADPDRAAKTLQAALEKVLLRSSEIMGTPEILEAHSLQPPEPLECDPGNPVWSGWAEFRRLAAEFRLLPGGKGPGC